MNTKELKRKRELVAAGHDPRDAAFVAMHEREIGTELDAEIIGKNGADAGKIIHGAGSTAALVKSILEKDLSVAQPAETPSGEVAQPEQ